MKREDAVMLIRELIIAEIQTVKQENFRAKGCTKGALKREVSAVRSVFAAIIGESPNDKEIEEMIGL